MNADTFNSRYPVGTPVFAYPGARPEDFPNDRRLVTRTRSKASVLGGHTDVVWVDGHSACIALSHVDVVSEWDDGERRAPGFRLVAYPAARGTCAAYFPEANVLVPLDSTAEVSGTPTSKSIIVRFEPA